MNFTKTVKLTKTPIACHYRGWNSFSCDHLKIMKITGKWISRSIFLELHVRLQRHILNSIHCTDVHVDLHVKRYTSMKFAGRHSLDTADKRRVHCNRKLPIDLRCATHARAYIYVEYYTVCVCRTIFSPKVLSACGVFCTCSQISNVSIIKRDFFLADYWWNFMPMSDHGVMNTFCIEVHCVSLRHVAQCRDYF